MAEQEVEVPEEEQRAEDQRVSPWDELKQRVERDSTRTKDFADSVKAERMRLQSEEAEAQREPTEWHDYVTDVPKGAWGATVNLATEATILVNKTQEFVLPVRQIGGGLYGIMNGEGWSEGVFDARERFAANEAALRVSASKIKPETKTLVGAGTEGIAQFLVPYVSWMKWAKGAQVARAGTFTEATIVGALIDGGLFDPNQGNLSSLIKAHNPEQQDAIWLFLATDPDDDEAVNRLKNALEGAVFGTIAEGVFKLARMGIAANKVRTARNNANASDDQMLTKEQLETLTAKPEPDPQFEFDELEILVDGQGTVINAKDSGRMGLMERGGETLQVVDSQVDEAYRGKGNGKKLYDAAARLADERGLKLTSDTSVSQDAVNVWESRIRAGEDITDLRKTEPDQVTITEEVIDGKTKVTYGSAPGKPIFVRNAGKAADDAADAAGGAKKEAGAEGERKFFHEEHIRQTLKLDATQRKMLNDALLAGDDKTASQILELHDFNIDTIDWDAVKDPDDIKKLINLISEVTADHIDEVKGGVQTHAQTARMANLVGKTGDDVHQLFGDIRSDGGIAARFLAAKRTMMMAAREAQRLIREAKAAPGDKAKASAMMKHLQLYAAIQAEVKGSQTEIARAMNSMKILVDDAGTNFKEFDEIMRQFGGRSQGSRNFEKYMDSLLDALDRGDIDGFNRGVRMTTGERAKNIVVEYVINAMLSSPATHKINFISNSLNTILFSMDRLLAGSYRYARHGDKAALREFRLDIVRKFTGMGEAWRFARQAWKEGAPISDMRQRLEFNTRQSISAEGTVRRTDEGNIVTGADDALPNRGEKFFAPRSEAVRNMDGQVTAVVDYTWPQRAINTLGRFVRIPGRALITGDEFFKTINRNAELSVLSFRKADDEAVAQGLEYGTDAYEKFVKKRTAALLDPNNATVEARDIRTASIEQARKAAFQESPTTGGGRVLEKAINHNRFVKLLIAPFFRTPMNILRQGTVDRMPWGRWLGETKEIIESGHPRARSEAIARTYTGVSAMAMSYIAISNLSDPEGMFEIRGKTEYDSSINQTQSNDYSIRFGDTWYQFNRLDPMGLWLGMVADLHKASLSAEDEDEAAIESMGQAVLGTFMSNVVNKTWMKSLSDMLDFAETASKRSISDEAAQRAWARMAGGQFGKFIPQFIKTSGRNLEAQITGQETYAREAWTAFDNIKATLPVFNKDLPKRYDALGREKTYPTQGFSPLKQSPEAQSPIDKELQVLDFTLKPMQKSLVSGDLPLTAEEFSEMNRLVGTVPIGGQTLEEALNELVTSDVYQKFTKHRKIYEIKLRIQAARAAAKGMMLQDEEFKAKWSKAIQENPLALIQE